MDDGIIVDIFGMPNVKLLELKETDYGSILNLTKENFGSNPVKSKEFIVIGWEGTTL